MMHILHGASVAVMLAQAAGGPSAGSGGISGRAIDAASRAPIAGARVNMVFVVETRGGSLGREPRQTVTDENGRFALTGLGAGRYSLSVERNGFAPYPDVLAGPPSPIESGGRPIDRHPRNHHAQGGGFRRTNPRRRGRAGGWRAGDGDEADRIRRLVRFPAVRTNRTDQRRRRISTGRARGGRVCDRGGAASGRSVLQF